MGLRLGICDKIIDKTSPGGALEETVIWLESMIGHDISVINSIKQVLTHDAMKKINLLMRELYLLHYGQLNCEMKN